MTHYGRGGWFLASGSAMSEVGRAIVAVIVIAAGQECDSLALAARLLTL